MTVSAGVGKGSQQFARGAVVQVADAAVGPLRVVAVGSDQHIIANGRDVPAKHIVGVGIGAGEGLQQLVGVAVEQVGRSGEVDPVRGSPGRRDQHVVSDRRHMVAERPGIVGVRRSELVQQFARAAVEEIGGVLAAHQHVIPDRGHGEAEAGPSALGVEVGLDELAGGGVVAVYGPGVDSGAVVPLNAHQHVLPNEGHRGSAAGVGGPERSQRPGVGLHEFQRSVDPLEFDDPTGQAQFALVLDAVLIGVFEDDSVGRR